MKIIQEANRIQKKCSGKCSNIKDVSNVMLVKLKQLESASAFENLNKYGVCFSYVLIRVSSAEIGKFSGMMW
jgi:hypothetical protein